MQTYTQIDEYPEAHSPYAKPQPKRPNNPGSVIWDQRFFFNVTVTLVDLFAVQYH